MGLWTTIKNLLVTGDMEVKGKVTFKHPPWPTPPRACDTVVTETAFGQASAPGSSPNFSRCDHTHGTPPAFNDYFIQTFGGTDQTGALMGEPQPDIVAGLTVILMHDGYYYMSPV